MADLGLWVVIDRTGSVLQVYDYAHEERARDDIESDDRQHGCGIVLIGTRHPQHDRLARHETGFLLDGYGPEPA